MEIKLDTDTIKSLIGESIMTSLTEEKRNALIQGAVEYLLTQNKNPYNDRTESPIESVFKSAIRDIAETIATESLFHDGRVREIIRKMISDAVERMMDDKNYDVVVGRIRQAITDGLTRR
jgi:hypothetical protein